MLREETLHHGLLLILLLVLSVVSMPATAQIDSLGEAINKAGRQRMLTQRMLKSYSMIGLDVQPAEAKMQRDEAVALFGLQLAELQAYSPNPATKKALQEVKRLWQSFKPRITGPVSRKAAAGMLIANDALLQAADRVVRELEKLSKTPKGRLVNIAGRQRMLSQRLAKFYMLRAWGVETPAILAAEKKAREEFEQAMQTLKLAKQNTPAIEQALDKAGLQWDLLRHALDREGENFIPLIVAMTSENLLRTMDQITGMYTELSR